MKTITRAAWACAAALLLVACGGGGGGTTRPPVDPVPSRVTATNEATVARVALLGGLAAARVGTVQSGGIGAAAAAATDAVRSVLRATERVRPAAVVAAPAEACDGGGTRSATFDDRDGDGITSVGDVVTVVFANCVFDHVRLDGTTVSTINQVQAPLYLGAAFEFRQLVVTTGSVVSTLTGGASISETDDPTWTTVDIHAGSSGLAVTSSAPTFSETDTLYGGFEIKTQVKGDGSGLVWLSGAFASSLLPALDGMFSVQTMAPLAISAASAYPSAGQLLALGTAGGNVQITVVDSTRVRLDLNARVAGDGGSDATTAVDWTSLMSQ